MYHIYPHKHEIHLADLATTFCGVFSKTGDYPAEDFDYYLHTRTPVDPKHGCVRCLDLYVYWEIANLI